MKEEPDTSTKVKQEYPVTRGNTNSSQGGKVLSRDSRHSTRNSAAAAVENIKAGNIQLGHKPQVSCARLTVYTGKEGEEKIYKSDDEISVDEHKTEMPVEPPVEHPRCMIVSSQSYKHPQTAKCGRVKTLMSQLNTPCELSNFKAGDTEKMSTEIIEEQSYFISYLMLRSKHLTLNTRIGWWHRGCWI